MTGTAHTFNEDIRRGLRADQPSEQAWQDDRPSLVQPGSATIVAALGAASDHLADGQHAAVLLVHARPVTLACDPRDTLAGAVDDACSTRKQADLVLVVTRHADCLTVRDRDGLLIHRQSR